jgi:hypothetical protein
LIVFGSSAREDQRMASRVFVLLAASLLLSACGITGNFRNDPGYAAFGSPGFLVTDRELALSLGPLPLRVARWLLDDDPEIGPLLKQLRAVRIYTYEVSGHADEVARRVGDIHTALIDDGWLSVVAVREHDELTSVLLRPTSDGSNRGLTVIVQDPSEVVLVNLIGNVRLDLFNDYMREIDVEAPQIEIDPATLQAWVHSSSTPGDHSRSVTP